MKPKIDISNVRPSFEQDGIMVINERCESVLASMDDSSVDLIATDPPYFKVKGDWWDRQWDNPEAFLAWMGELCDEWRRVLKPNGSLYVFASPQMSHAVETEVRRRFTVLTNIRWRKPPFSTKAEMFDKDELRAPFPASETIIFAEHYGSDDGAMADAGYMSACEATKRAVIGDYLRAEFERAGVTNKQVAALFPSKTGGLTGCVSNWLLGANVPTPEQYEAIRNHLNALNGEQYLRREYEDLRREYEDLRRPFNASENRPYTDVWDYATVSNYPGKHPCEKPLAMMEHIVETSSRPGALVLDCFAGSGVVGEACRNFGRRAILCEVDERWYRKISSRIGQRSLFAG